MTRLIVIAFFLISSVACAESLETRTKEERYFEYFRVAIQVYFEDCKKLPQSFSQLLDSSEGCEKWNGPYIKDDVTDSWGKLYVLELVGDRSLRVTSGGKDKVLGTSDDLSILVNVKF